MFTRKKPKQQAVTTSWCVSRCRPFKSKQFSTAASCRQSALLFLQTLTRVLCLSAGRCLWEASAGKRVKRTWRITSLNLARCQTAPLKWTRTPADPEASALFSSKTLPAWTRWVIRWILFWGNFDKSKWILLEALSSLKQTRGVNWSLTFFGKWVTYWWQLKWWNYSGNKRFLMHWNAPCM